MKRKRRTNALPVMRSTEDRQRELDKAIDLISHDIKMMYLAFRVLEEGRNFDNLDRFDEAYANIVRHLAATRFQGLFIEAVCVGGKESFKQRYRDEMQAVETWIASALGAIKVIDKSAQEKKQDGGVSQWIKSIISRRKQ